MYQILKNIAEIWILKIKIFITELFVEIFVMRVDYFNGYSFII